MAGDEVLAIVQDTSVRQPWERQEGEGEDEWTAFKGFRDMHPRVIHRAGFIGGVRVSSEKLSRWYRQWKWAERVEAYDVLTDRIVQAQRKKTIEESVADISADQLAYLGRLRRLIDLELGKFLEAAESGNGPGLIKPAELASLIDKEVKLTRIIKGESTENVDVRTDLSGMDPAALMEWRARIKGLPSKDTKKPS